MGYVQQAVQEFDEEVRVPWRPRLVLVQESPTQTTDAVAAARHRPARPGASRVGTCRPSVSPATRLPTAATRSAGGRRAGSAACPGSPAAAGTRAGRRRAAVRFTRRAHRVAVALALCGGVLAGSLIGQLFPGGSPDLRLAGGSSVVVDSGDTLWSIAATVAPEEDVRLVVDRIQELNGLRSTELVPGQVLLLP